METEGIEEIRETRSVDRANQLLRTGWKLLTIVENRRWHTYVLGARTALEMPAPTPATLTDTPADA